MLSLVNELENRIKDLDKLVDSLGTPQALDLVNDLGVRLSASQNLLQVAKLLREPARESMLSKIRDSLNDLEEAIASRSSVKTS